jgi:hypothetical protein
VVGDEVRLGLVTSAIADRLKQQKALLGIATIGVGILVSDFLPTMNHFWSAHQVATSIVAGAVLALGLDRLIAKREAERWRPLALLIVDRLGSGIDGLDSTLQDRTLGYCCKVYGAWEVPVGREFFGMLIESLQDPETWEGFDEIPSLLDEVATYVEDGESTLEKWAPLLVADSRLAEIGACATRIHTLGSSALIALTYIWVDLNAVLPISEEKRVRNRASLLVVVRSYRDALEQFRQLSSEFCGPDDLRRMAVRNAGSR